MADSELLRMIEKPKIEKSSNYRQLIQYFPYFVIELKRKRVNLQLLWQEYKQIPLLVQDCLKNIRIILHIRVVSFLGIINRNNSL